MKVKERVRVHITDNHELVVEGFKSLLEANNIHVVGSSLNGDDLINWVNDHQADIILLDISMPQKNGIEVLEYFRNNKLTPKVIVVSSYLRLDLISMAIGLGAKGFVIKSEAATCIIEAIHTIEKGGYYYSEEVKELLVNKKLLPGNNDQKEVATKLLKMALSPQELNVLKLLVNEYSSDEIEEELNIKKSTIRTYTSRIREKLEVENNIGLVLRYSFLKRRNS